MKFDAVYYEPAIFDYPLGRQLREEYGDLPWIPIESHNSTVSYTHLTLPTN